MDPFGQFRVLGPASRHVAMAVLRLIGRQPRELHLPAGIVAEASVEVPAPESPRVHGGVLGGNYMRIV